MDQEARNIAIQALQFLLLDSKLEGVRFRGTGFTLLFDPVRVEAGEIFLYLDSDWAILPEPLESEHTIAFTSQKETSAEQLAQLYSLNNKPITQVSVGTEIPHLIIQFENTQVFVVNGHDEQYESWEIGTALKEETADFTIVAIPGDRIAVWTPKDFR
jgi:hypothetical protein